MEAAEKAVSVNTGSYSFWLCHFIKSVVHFVGVFSGDHFE